VHSGLKGGVEAVGKVAGAAQNRAGDAIERAQDAYVKGAYSSMAMNVGGYLKERLDLGALHEAGFGARGEILQRRRKEARMLLLDLSGPVRARVLLALRETVKDSALADPDMWDCARTRLSASI
ncbi:unnamed protein product, partial [Polarella glacialis]